MLGGPQSLDCRGSPLQSRLWPLQDRNADQSACHGNARRQVRDRGHHIGVAETFERQGADQVYEVITTVLSGDIEDIQEAVKSVIDLLPGLVVTIAKIGK